MNAIDIMNREVATCGPQDSLNRAAQLMWERDIGCLPVVDAENRPVGMITDRDICMAAYTQGGALSSLQVGNAMSRDVSTCDANDTIDRAERRMREHQVRRLPVVDSGKLVGIVSLNDIALAATDKRQKDLSFQDVGQTLSAICRHRELPRVSVQAA